MSVWTFWTTDVSVPKGIPIIISGTPDAGAVHAGVSLPIPGKFLAKASLPKCPCATMPIGAYNLHARKPGTDF